MSLADGDYIIIQDHLVDAIEADTGDDGLMGGDDPPVKTVEAELRGEPRAYREHETPAIAVVVLGKDEKRGAGESVRSYRLAFFIYVRGLDSELEMARCQRIANRIEDLLREENDPSRRLCDLPGDLAWSAGVIDLTPGHTEFLTENEVNRGKPRYAVMGLIEATLDIPAAVY